MKYTEIRLDKYKEKAIKSTYSCHGWEFEESLFDTAIVINMDGVLEHEVYEVRVGLDEVVQILQILQLASLFLVKDVKVVLRGV